MHLSFVCRKVEDLQFSLEEESINKDDLETKTASDLEKLQGLEDQLKEQRERADKLEKEHQSWKVNYVLNRVKMSPLTDKDCTIEIKFFGTCHRTESRGTKCGKNKTLFNPYRLVLQCSPGIKNLMRN